MREFQIAVLPGDGIGLEVMAPCLALLEAVVAQTGGFRLRFAQLEGGAQCYLDTGVALPEAALRTAASADAILLGAMGIPDVRYPNGTEVVPQIDLREHFQLYAGIRPVRVFPGVPIPLGDARARHIDFVLVRESTEGLFSARTLSQRQGDDVVLDTMRITRQGCERLFKVAFEVARRRRRPDRQPRVTCVDKANVLPSMAFFRSIFLECAAGYPDVRRGLRIRGRGRAAFRALAVGVRRARHREHVRRHSLGPWRRAHGRHGDGPVGRPWRRAGDLSTVSRDGTRHCRDAGSPIQARCSCPPP